ncbi:sensor histidine kinase [Micrococcus lylae]|uniref:sensor histidine kinase n=1 Tax=Micrococcus lylae TaxID=1273 RepID=UPI003EC14249
MNPLRRIDAFHREHPFASDVIVACTMLVFQVAMPYLMFAPGGGMFGVPDTPGPLVMIDAVVDAALVSTWAFRRRAPVAAIRCAVALCLVMLLIGPDFSLSLIVVPMYVHHAAATFSRRGSLIVLAIALAGAVARGVKTGWFPRMTMIGGVPASSEAPLIALAIAIPCAAVVLAAWAYGDVVRTRLIAVRATEDRAHRLEVQAQQERELAAADERNRIAREMHDIVSHSLQVMISQADGARYAAAAKPELAVQTLETIGRTGRSALAEMRALLGVLRAPSPPDDAAGTSAADGTSSSPSPRGAARHVFATAGALPSPSSRGPEAGPDADGQGEGPSSGRRRTGALLRPQPTLADLDELAETLRLSGLEVAVRTTGERRRELPAGGELAAYRIAQEALTNTLRHGGPDARAAVTLAWTAEGLELTVDDDGLGAASSPSTAGTGNGLRGMAERARLFGGTLEAGPPATGVGWRVTARLPYEAQ